MKQFALILAFIFAFAAPMYACDNPACTCEDCVCVNCDCNKVGERITPVDDSALPILMVLGNPNDVKYQNYVKWAKATTTRYHVVSTASPMYARYQSQVPVTPKVVIAKGNGGVIWKGEPANQRALFDRWRNSCPDGNCRPAPTPEPAPVPVDVGPVVEPIPDSDNSDGNYNWILYVLVGVVAAGAGVYQWWKATYFAK